MAYTRVLLWGVFLAVFAVDAHGQRLLEADGVELLGEAQLVMAGGGTCNVLESDTAYEANKENDGAPMDIWRLDFSVRNGSGRWLDHLIARYQIDSEWPDCTNWDGPGAGQFQPLEWADSIGFIQESGRNVVAPDQTLTQTKFFIVLRGDPEPRFANWSMDFDFAVNPPPATTAGTPGSPDPPPPITAEQENLFWQSIMNSTNPAEFEAYLAQFPNGVFRALAENRLEALRAPASSVPGGTGLRRAAAGSPGSGSRTVGGTDAPRRPGEVFRDCGECPEMVVIPAGTFRMGCVSGRNCRDNEQPVHAVTISRPFALSKYEVTFEEYDRFTAATGRAQADDEGWGRGRRPVINVTWNDAQDYVAWLWSETGGRYRLPSEAEWEYAARAGTTTAYSWGNAIGNNRAHCNGCSSQWDNRMTAPVGSFGANAWGLHEMHGNMLEWVEDCWHDSYVGAPTNESAWESGGCSRRVLRGGSWFDLSRYLRAAYRLRDISGDRSIFIGFRVARMLAP